MNTLSQTFLNLTAALFNLFISSHTPLVPPTPVLTPSSSALDSMSTVTHNTQQFKYALVHISQDTPLTLFPNFKQQSPSLHLADRHSCQYLFNAGFYTPDHQPIGWFFSPDLSSPHQQNQLFDAVFYLDQAQIGHLDFSPPNQAVRFGFQSGPLLIHNSQPSILSLKSDQPARRLILALTKTGDYLFIAVTDTDSLLTGPNLTQLPQILQSILTQENLAVSAALNLDGGTASTFYTPTFHIEEINPIGSFFCISTPQ